jgi:hypothetical protein
MRGAKGVIIITTVIDRHGESASDLFTIGGVK